MGVPIQLPPRRRFTFDDLGVGTFSESGNSVDLRLIPRTSDLSQRQWYEQAKKIIELLNTVDNGNPIPDHLRYTLRDD